jgi:hypothetical protein
VKTAGAYRPKRLIPGIRIVGDGADSSWAQLRDSIALTRRLGQGSRPTTIDNALVRPRPSDLNQLALALAGAVQPDPCMALSF